jgi:hypothetical protein
MLFFTISLVFHWAVVENSWEVYNQKSEPICVLRYIWIVNIDRHNCLVWLKRFHYSTHRWPTSQVVASDRRVPQVVLSANGP